MSETKRDARLAARIRHGCPPALTMDGHALSTNDAKRVAISYMLWLLVRQDVCRLLDDHFGLEKGKGYSRTCSASNSMQLLSQMYATDVKTIVDSLKALLQVLRHIPAERICSKTARNSIIRELYAQYDVDTTVCIVPDLTFMIRQVICTGDAYLFREVNTLLQFFIRLTLSDVDWIEEENIAKYKDMEIRLHNQVYDSDLLPEVKAVITEWFSHVDFEPAIGKHGYGATYGVGRSKGTDAKYHDMVTTSEAGKFFSFMDWRPNDAYAWPGLDSSYQYAAVNTAAPGVLHSRDLLCKMQLVPKGVDKKRVISMEPTVHQFEQKMLQLVMSNHFDRHPEMRISLHNQEHNRSLCLKGSVRGEYATIDLSSASDTVTRTLVEYLFRDTPLFYPLMWSRTSRVELPDGSIIDLEKFAPMGSSCCFPVECTVFSAIIAAVQRRLGVHYYYRVYGDDMVVHRKVYDAVIAALEELHFDVNEDKSFGHGSVFTESCGIEAWKGHDVSPLRLSRKFDLTAFLRCVGNSKHPKATSNGITQLSDMYDLGNAAYDREYFSLRRAVIRITQEVIPECAFSHNYECGFFTTGNVTNWRHRVRFDWHWCRDLQQKAGTRTEYVRIYTIVSDTEPGDEALRYSKCLEELMSSQREHLIFPEDRKDVASGASTTYGKYEWIRRSDLERWYFEPRPAQGDGLVSVMMLGLAAE